MTREELDDSIDENIGNKTELNSIQPSDDAENRKLIADYVDQEVITKVLKRTLTHNELLNINSTPITLLPAVEGIAYLPKDIIVKYVDNDGWASAGTWRVLLDAVQMTNFASQMGGTTNKEQAAYLLLGNPSNTTTSFFNKAVTLTSSANPTVPVNEDATAVIYMSYFVFNE